MKSINEEAGFFKMYWDLLQQGQLLAIPVLDENGNVKRNSKGEPKYKYPVSTQSLLLLSYLIGTWDKQTDFITDDNGVIYKRYAWSYIRERLYDYSDSILRNCVNELQKNGFIVLKKLHDNPKSYQFISLNFENRIKNFDTNKNIIIETKRMETKRIIDEEEGVTSSSSSSLSSKTDDIVFLSKCVDRILGMDGKQVYLDEIYEYALPLLEENSVEDLVLTFNWYKYYLGEGNNPQGIRYPVSVKNVFRGDRFVKNLTDARNYNGELTDLSDLYLERLKQKNPEEYAKQEENRRKKEEEDEMRCKKQKLVDSIDEIIDNFCKKKFQALSQEGRVELRNAIYYSPHRKDGTLKKILDEVINDETAVYQDLLRMLKE